jgi:hypothetical protein
LPLDRFFGPLDQIRGADHFGQIDPLQREQNGTGNTGNDLTEIRLGYGFFLFVAIVFVRQLIYLPGSLLPNEPVSSSLAWIRTRFARIAIQSSRSVNSE